MGTDNRGINQPVLGVRSSRERCQHALPHFSDAPVDKAFVHLFQAPYSRLKQPPPCAAPADLVHRVEKAAAQTFRPLLATGYEARLLGVPSGTAVFEVERTNFVDAHPVEWRRTLARGDHYIYAVDLVNPREAGSA